MAKKTIVSREVYGPVIRLAVGLVILVIINAILKNLPMIRTLAIPDVPFSGGAIVSVVIGIIMIVMFLNFRRDFAPRFQAALPAFPDSGRVASSAINLGIIIIAYSMFDGLILPLMRGFSWAYSLVFLLIAIAPLYGLVMTLYRSSEKITDLLSGKVAEATGELTKCSQCGETNPSTAKFCTSCGADLESAREVVQGITSLRCPKCSTENSPDAKFCQNCGAPLSETKQNKA